MSMTEAQARREGIRDGLRAMMRGSALWRSVGGDYAELQRELNVAPDLSQAHVALYYKTGARDALRDVLARAYAGEAGEDYHDVASVLDEMTGRKK